MSKYTRLGHNQLAWVALHLFTGGSIDELLVRGVGPFCRRLSECGQIRRMFFLRYWNGGPHCRLRLEVGSDQREEVVRLATESLSGWVVAGEPIDEAEYLLNAAPLIEATAVAARQGRGALEILEPLQPLGTIAQRTYQFDAARYGEENQDVVEDHFCEASAAALTLLERWSDDRDALLVLGIFLAKAAAVAAAPDSNERAFLSNAAAGAERLTGIKAAVTKDMAAALAKVRTRIDFDTSGEAHVAAWWANELKKRLAALVDTAALGNDTRTALTIDFLHLFFNRIGLGLTEEAFAWRAACLL